MITINRVNQLSGRTEPAHPCRPEPRRNGAWPAGASG